MLPLAAVVVKPVLVASDRRLSISDSWGTAHGRRASSLVEITELRHVRNLMIHNLDWTEATGL